VADYRLAASAEAALDDILSWTQDNFGDMARERYAALLVTAMYDVAEEPRRTNVSWKRLKRADVGIYHIMHSKGRVPDPPGQVGEPRHLIVFREGGDGIIEILGFIHESMLMPRALRQLVRPRGN
jgi:toxin ParE1/3/4